VWQPFAQGFSRTGHRYHLKYPQLRLLLLFAESTKRFRDFATSSRGSTAARHGLRNSL
jgi:hypothetical protein